MRLVRFQTHGRGPACGILQEDEIAELGGEGFSSFKTLKACHPLAQAALLAPCVPSKIIAVGLNYRDHAAELGMAVPESPILFLKPPTSIIGSGEAIITPPGVGRVDYEGELGVVIKDRVSRIDPGEAREHILGYLCANDVTARDVQKTDGQWTRAKSYDTFCPIGPWIETDLDPDDLLIETHVNGERRQSSRTSQFVFSVPRLVSFISHVMTLLPGDLIITGTPPGIGPLLPGDRVEVRIDGIGSLCNTVRGS